MFDLNAHRQKFEGALVYFKQDIGGLRTGRATPALVEHLSVDAYGVRTPLLQLASIGAPDPKTIVIQPWDKALVKEIERAIHESDINTAPTVDGTIIRITMPPLTEDNRKQLVKILHDKAEFCRVSLRQQREKVRTDLSAAETAGTISEDEKFQAQKHLDEMIKEFNDRVKEVTDKKEQEIMTL